MQRLGGISFSGEIIALKEMHISESQKAECLQLVQNVEEKLVDVTEKLRLIEAQQNDPLPKHIRGKYYINKWHRTEHRRKLKL